MVATAEACVSRELSLSIGSILVPGISEIIRLVEGRVVLPGLFLRYKRLSVRICVRENPPKWSRRRSITVPILTHAFSSSKFWVTPLGVLEP